MPSLSQTQNGNGTVVDDGAKRGVEEEWSVDTSEAAIKARMEKLSDQASALTLNKDLERPQGERVNMFYTFVEDIKLKGGVAAVAGALTKIKAEAERLDVMDLAAGILAELLYTEKLLTQIKEYRPIMLHVSCVQSMFVRIVRWLFVLTIFWGFLVLEVSNYEFASLHTGC